MSKILLDRTTTRAILTLNSPTRHNALSREMKRELNEKLDALKKDDQLRVLILTGAGEAFCAGTDIHELSRMDESDASALSHEGQELCERIEKFPVPVIAAVNGIAAGGGFELALACHLRIASTTSSFSLPETRLGLIPGYDGTQRLAREVGAGPAIELMLAQKSLSGEDAFRIGIVNRLAVPDVLMTETLSLATEIEQLSPLSIRACLKAISDGLNLSLDEGLTLETELFSSLFASEDAKEGTLAFLEKRKPRFKGR